MIKKILIEKKYLKFFKMFSETQVMIMAKLSFFQ